MDLRLRGDERSKGAGAEGNLRGPSGPPQPARDRGPAGGRPPGADARQRIRREGQKTAQPVRVSEPGVSAKNLPYFTQLLFGAGFGARQTVAAEIAWMPTGL